MTAQTQKLSLKKETLRQLEPAQLPQLDGVVGGAAPIVTTTVGTTSTITITLTETLV